MIQNKRFDIEAFQGQSLRSMASTDFYSLLEYHEIHVEGIFRGVQHVWCRDYEALGYLSLPQPLLQDIQLEAYQLPPGLFDICSQLFIAALPQAHVQGKRIQYLVSRLQRFKVYGPLSANIWAYVQIKNGDTLMSNLTEGDLHLLADDGTPLATVQGLRLQQYTQATIQPSASTSAPAIDDFYSLLWETQEQASSFIDFRELFPQKWLLFLDEQGVGQQLLELLEAQGHQCISVTRGPQFCQLSEHAYQINHTDPQAYTLLIEIEQQSHTQKFAGIVHLWSLDATPTEQTDEQSLLSDQLLGIESALRIMQVCVTLSDEPFPRVWFVTRGAQAVNEQQTSLAISQSPLWGLGKTFAMEYPEFWGGLIDLDPDDSDQATSAYLLQSILNGGETTDDLLAFRQGRPYGARLVQSPPSVLHQQPISLRSDASYLITGGLEGIGLEITRWFVHQGARYIVLLGSTQLPPRPQWQHLKPGNPHLENIAKIHALEASGAQIQYAAVDVANQMQLAALLTTLPLLGYPELRGVVHTTSLSQSSQGPSLTQPIVRLTTKALHAIFRPKVLGSWLLARQVKDISLDFFVSFSSGASLVGTATQGAYAAAGEFLDALASYQRAQGQPAISIDWGLTASEETHEDQRLSDYLEAHGLQSLTPAQIQAAFAHLLPPQQARIGVMRANWSFIKESFPRVATRRLFQHLTTLPSPDPSIESAIAQRIKYADPEQQHPLLVGYLQSRLAHTLRQSIEYTPTNRSLLALGLDSLMALELKQSIETEFNLAIPITTFLRGPSIEEFAASLLTLMKDETQASATSTPITAPMQQSFGEDVQTTDRLPPIDPDGQIGTEQADAASAPGPSTRQQTIELVRKQLSQLSKAQIDALLAQLMEAEEHK